MTATNYLEEDSATLKEIAERYRYTAGWLSLWLDRLERIVSEPFEDVVYDDHRSGRPSELSEKHEQFDKSLHKSPQNVGLGLTRLRGLFRSRARTFVTSST